MEIHVSRCSICGSVINTDCQCPNSWRSDHDADINPFYAPSPWPTSSPACSQPPEYFSSAPAILEVLTEIRDLLTTLVERTQEGE